MLTDLRKGLWSELLASNNIDAFRRNLQRTHIERMEELIKAR
jgi:hypothetical protein